MKPHTSTSRRRHLDDTQRDLTQIDAILEPAMNLIHDSLNGHPRAARYDSDGGTNRLWCFTHQRDHRDCETEALDCGGTPINGGDPTGDAALNHDRAAAAQRLIDRHLTAIAAFAARLATELTAWSPAVSAIGKLDRSSPTAPDGWCTHCWLDDQSECHIARRDGGKGAPYYAGLCGWCGSMKADLGGALPPMALVRAHHIGRVPKTLLDMYNPKSRTA